MTDVLGQSGADAMVVLLNLGDIPYEPEEIDEKLTRTFRRAGAKVIERQVLKLIFDEIVDRFDERDDLPFIKQVELAGRQYMTTRESST